MKTSTNPAITALRYHVTGAIERGEAQAITEVPAPHSPAHTPGPWYLNSRGWVVQSTGDIVTRLECSNNKESDARLIAAAPELLAELERTEAGLTAILCSRVIHSTTSTWLELRRNRDAIRSAIARATGNQ